jgi:hypothetical protein
MASATPPSLADEQPLELEAEKKEQELSSLPSDDNQPESNQVFEPAASTPTTQEQEWISGFKLFTIMTAITLPCLLLLLDTSIIVTAGV